MPYVLIQHQVKDYATLEKVFLDDGERRRRSGSKGGRLLRNVDDPGNLIAIFEWDGLERANEFANGLELHEAMEWASAGTTSTVMVLEDVLEVDA